MDPPKAWNNEDGTLRERDPVYPVEEVGASWDAGVLDSIPTSQGQVPRAGLLGAVQP